MRIDGKMRTSLRWMSSGLLCVCVSYVTFVVIANNLQANGAGGWWMVFSHACFRTLVFNHLPPNRQIHNKALHIVYAINRAKERATQHEIIRVRLRT